MSGCKHLRTTGNQHFLSRSFVFVRLSRRWTVTKTVQVSLQQVPQLVLEVSGMFHTGGGRHTNKHIISCCSELPHLRKRRQRSSQTPKLRRVVLGLTFSEWPPAWGTKPERCFQQDFLRQFGVSRGHSPHAAGFDTHWYCKCVVIIDIFLRLWRINNTGCKYSEWSQQELSHTTREENTYIFRVQNGVLLKDRVPGCLPQKLEEKSAEVRVAEKDFFSSILQWYYKWNMNTGGGIEPPTFSLEVLKSCELISKSDYTTDIANILLSLLLNHVTKASLRSQFDFFFFFLKIQTISNIWQYLAARRFSG